MAAFNRPRLSSIDGGACADVAPAHRLCVSEDVQQPAAAVARSVKCQLPPLHVSDARAATASVPAADDADDGADGAAFGAEVGRPRAASVRAASVRSSISSPKPRSSDATCSGSGGAAGGQWRRYRSGEFLNIYKT